MSNSDSITVSESWNFLHFFGRRRDKPKAIPLWRVLLWSFIGAFLGIAIVEILFTYSSYFRVEHDVPVLVGSLGATAVLIYGTIDAPLAQPRNLFGGTIISSVVGVVISKLFLGINTPPVAYDHVRWVAGATAVAITLVLMQVAKAVHPPCGATAVLAVISPEVVALGWYYIPVVLLSVTLMFVVALVVDNIERRYPAYWWTPLAPPEPNEPGVVENAGDRREVSLSIESSETQDQNRILNIDDIPSGVLDPEEKEILRRIYQKVYM